MTELNFYTPQDATFQRVFFDNFNYIHLTL